MSYYSQPGSFAESIIGKLDGSFLEGGRKPDLGVAGCFIHMLRGNLGPGCLSLPFAFASAGIYLSWGLSIPIILLCLFSFNVLLWAKQDVVTHGLAPAGIRLSYSDIAVAAMGPPGRILVEVAVCTTQLGVCIVFYSFVATNINSVWPDLGKQWLIVGMMPVAGAMTLIKTPGKLAILSLIGNICMATGLILVFVALAPNLSTGVKTVMGSDSPKVHWSSAPSFASNMIFSFEGIALVIPMEFAMIQPEKFPMIMTTAMSTVGVIFVVFATYCLIGLDGNVQDGSISAAMADSGLVSEFYLTSTNLILGLAVLSTYPLQFYPAAEIFDVHLVAAGVSASSWWPVAVRLGMSTVCGLVAVAVPDVNKLVSLVGSLGSPMLGLLIPPLVHMKASRQPIHIIILDLLCLALGLFALIFGTIASVKDIVER